MRGQAASVGQRCDMLPLAARRLTLPLPPRHARTQSELNEWLRSPPEGCRLVQFDPLTTWVVEMQGPETSPESAHPLYRGADA